MANTNVLPVGSSVTQSSQTSVAAPPVAFLMIGGPTPSTGNMGVVQALGTDGSWVEIGRLTADAPRFVITSPGTYAVTRMTAAGGNWGVDIDV
ncbi:MAG TPA: hypothetical protein VJQ26_02615 [Ktedonobacteraceae bacterium]|nr:hypothetical protein [Ktedonobacteraceae bacterium]